MADLCHTMCKRRVQWKPCTEQVPLKACSFNTMRFWERLSLCSKSCIKAALSNNQDSVCISRGKVWNVIHAYSPPISVRRGRGSEWEEVMRINKLTTDNVYRSPFTGKRPKVFYQLCAEINPFVTERGQAHLWTQIWLPLNAWSYLPWNEMKECWKPTVCRWGVIQSSLKCIIA